MKLRRILLLAAVLVLALAMTALAAEAPAAPAFSVQLDGEVLNFTDAVPQARDGRTFLPFRAVFEAMGADVVWNAETPELITAARGDKTVVMAVGSTEAKVIEGEEETSITMDVAPYVDPAVSRTYVPVRFAAQAFGCAVGWDQSAMTAVIVDAEKLVNEALAGKSFTYLEELAKASEKYNEGIWDVTMDMDGAVSFLGLKMPITVTAGGTEADETRMDLDMNMKMDLSALAFLMALDANNAGMPDAAELDPEEAEAIRLLAEEGVDLGIRGDLGTGVLYLNMAGQILADNGLDPEVWYELDMNDLLREAGLDMDFAQLMEQSKNVELVPLVKTVLSAASVDSAAAGYATVKEAVDLLVNTLADDAFVRDGDRYTTTLALEQDDAAAGMVLTLIRKDGAVTSYELGLSLDIDMGSDPVSLGMGLAMSEDDKLSGGVTMDISGVIAAELNIEAAYTPGTAAPETQPPAGAPVISYEELMNM